MRTTRECYQDKTIKSVRFIYASEDAAVCDKLELITQDYVSMPTNTEDQICTKEQNAKLVEIPMIVEIEDGRLTPEMEKFYSVMGVLFVIVIILGICLFLAKKKLKKILLSMQTTDAVSPRQIAMGNAGIEFDNELQMRQEGNQ